MPFPFLAAGGLAAGALGSLFGGGGGGNQQNQQMNEDYLRQMGYNQNRAQAGQGLQNLWGGAGQNLWGQLGGVANQASNQQQWQNPMWGDMMSQMRGMQNAPSAQRGAAGFQQQFGGMLQGGQPINWQNPQMQQTQMYPVTGQFMGMPVNQMQFGAPGMGQGGNIAMGVAGGGAPGATGPTGLMDPAQIQQARDAQLAGLTQMAGGGGVGGMGDQEISQMMEAAMAPVRRDINAAQGAALSDVSARGLGQSSEVGRVRGEFGDVLGEAGQQASARVLEQAVQSRLAANAQQQTARQAGLGGLGQFAGQGLEYELGRGGLGTQAQQIANQFALGRGNLGLGMGELTQQGGQFADQMNLAGNQQAFEQLAQQAGLGADLYQGDAGRALQQLGMGQQYQLGQQGLNADMSQFGANQMNQGLLSMLGMGMQGAGQDFGQQSQLLQQMLGAGGLDQSGFQSYMNNILAEQQGNQQLGYGGMLDLQQSMFGAGQNQEQFNQQLMAQMLQQQQQYGMQQQEAQGGGFGGLLGGLGGQLLGGMVPGASNWMNQQLGFGSPQPQINWANLFGGRV